MGLELQNCCFCVELRTGSFIIGYLNLVANIIITLLVILGLAGSGYVAAEAKDEEVQTAGLITVVALSIALIFIIINLIINIFLLVGLHKYKRGYIKAYLIYTSIFIVLSIIMFISKIATGGEAGKIVSDLITILLSIYSLLVIRSYYLKMDDPTKRPAIYNTA